MGLGHIIMSRISWARGKRHPFTFAAASLPPMMGSAMAERSLPCPCQAEWTGHGFDIVPLDAIEDISTWTNITCDAKGLLSSVLLHCVGDDWVARIKDRVGAARKIEGRDEKSLLDMYVRLWKAKVGIFQDGTNASGAIRDGGEST